ncbi:MAG TPA: hypothetical protein VFF25_04705 [Clostridia bacterium]|nr:hypothetical protein [Clostridia bacterium]
MGKEITNEQLFEFMTKMYSEMQEMGKDMVTKDDLAKTNQAIVKLENKIDANHKTSYDGYKLTYEKLTTLENRADEIDAKIDKHDVEIKKGTRGREFCPIM